MDGPSPLVHLCAADSVGGLHRRTAPIPLEWAEDRLRGFCIGGFGSNSGRFYVFDHYNFMAEILLSAHPPPSAPQPDPTFAPTAANGGRSPPPTEDCPQPLIVI